MSRVASLLDQTDVWIDGDAKVHRLDTMDRHHRANLIPFLRGNKITIYRVAHGVSAESPQTAEEWLDATPLMRRLIELEQGRPIDDRRATAERNAFHEVATGYRKVRAG